jgi:hypothetical protein
LLDVNKEIVCLHLKPILGTGAESSVPFGNAAEILFNVGGSASTRTGVKTDGSNLEVPDDVVLGGGSKATGAALTINGTSIVLPRVTTAVREAMTPVVGSTVFDTTLNQICCYDGSAWVTEEHTKGVPQPAAPSTEKYIFYMKNGLPNGVDADFYNSGTSVYSETAYTNNRLINVYPMFAVEIDRDAVVVVDTDPADFTVTPLDFVISGPSMGSILTLDTANDVVNVLKDGVYRVHVAINVQQVSGNNALLDNSLRLALVFNEDGTKRFGREYVGTYFDKPDDKTMYTNLEYTDIVTVDNVNAGGTFTIGLQWSAADSTAITYVHGGAEENLLNIEKLQ